MQVQAQYSVFGSILTIGAMIGAVTSGRIADMIGRKLAMALSDIFCVIGWIAISFAEASWMLNLGRLSVGIGIGIFSYVVPVYIAEITPKDHRGSFTTVNQLMICCGSSLVYLLGTFVTWRTTSLTGSIPCLLQLLGLFFIPESPRWLAKIGHHREFEESLKKLRGKDVDVMDEAGEIKEFTIDLQNYPEPSMLDLFQRKYLHSLIVGVGLMVLKQFGGINAICFYASAIFISAGFSSGDIGTISMVVVQIPMTLVGVFLMDRSGRRPLLMASAGGTCLGCFLVAMSFVFQDHEWLEKSNPILALIGLLVFAGSFSLGMGAIPWMIMSEIFPINMKGSAGSLVSLVSWFGSWIISFTFNFLMLWSSSGTFLIFAMVCGFTVVFVEKLVPETKGRTLEEIQASLNYFVVDKF